MLRVLLLIAMICQVLGCPYACTASVTTTSAGVRSEVGCRCCQREQTVPDNLPSDEQQDTGTECFCKSQFNTIQAVEVEQDIHSLAIWTMVESPPQLCANGDAALDTRQWRPGFGSGMGLRLAVQSLLL
ncbi:hypothetical protein [Anatilimnocola floriformis]|uniref:hypothetical protein n=1 Tax=Anatilimnocola floriformis TaxID=2948575 RepID=UPI0020C4AC02|nr:hypothetical protein [Anatilimnocola floriformis]